MQQPKVCVCRMPSSHFSAGPHSMPTDGVSARLLADREQAPGKHCPYRALCRESQSHSELGSSPNGRGPLGRQGSQGGLAPATTVSSPLGPSPQPSPVVEVLAREGEVLVQGLGLVALPVGQADPQHVALLGGHLRDKLVPQPVLARWVPEALQPNGKSVPVGFPRLPVRAFPRASRVGSPVGFP